MASWMCMSACICQCVWMQCCVCMIFMGFFCVCLCVQHTCLCYCISVCVCVCVSLSVYLFAFQIFVYECIHVCVHIIYMFACVNVKRLDHIHKICFCFSPAAYTSNFLGNGYIQYDLSRQAVQTTTDLLELRFKTNSPHGVIFYSSGNQGDFMVLQMNRGYLNFTIDLGQLLLPSPLALSVLSFFC